MVQENFVRELQNEIHYLRQERERAFMAMDQASELRAFDTRLNELQDSQAIFKETAHKISQLLQFKTISFYLVREADASFYQAYSTSADLTQLMDLELETLVQDQTFSYVLSKNRPLMFKASHASGHLLLHTLATPRRTRGMLIGLLSSDKKDISEYALFLLTQVLLSCTNFLESFEMYNNFHKLNKQLSETIQTLQQTNTDLANKNQQLKAEIEQRKKAEHYLRQSQETFQNIIENIADGYFEVDLKGNLSYCNTALAEMLGYKKHDLLGRNYTAHADPENIQTIFAGFNQIYRLESSEKYYGWELLHKNGQPVHVQTSVSLIRDEAGQKVGFRGLVRDITEHKIYENNLKLSEQRYRAIFENTGTPTFIVEEDTTISMANREVENFLGYARKEIEGKRSWTEFINAEDLQEMRKYHYLRRSNPLAAPRKYVCRGYDRFGEEKHCIFNVDMIPGTSKSVVSVLDITEKNKLEKQLNQAQKLEAVGTMAGGIAHEFNNLLQGISGNIQLLYQKQNKNSAEIRYTEKLDSLASRASEIVNRLLTFSRDADFYFQNINLNQLIHNSINLLRGTTPRSISLQIDLDQNIAPISADPTQMEQILLNLVNNAVHALDSAEGGTIRVGTRMISYAELPVGIHLPLHEHDNYLLWYVQDNGHGMDKNTQDKIFDPFFTTKGPGKGTGLGLALIYGIVEAHQGTIRCESEPSQGTVFEIYLPPSLETETETDQSLPQSDSEYALSPAGEASKTILLIDDEQSILEVTQEMLEESGYQVCTALDGEQALHIFARNKENIDLVLLDLGLPELSGEKCLQRLLELEPRARVIIASGYKTHKLAKTPQDFGVLDFLSKPYSLQHLLHKIRKHLD